MAAAQRGSIPGSAANQLRPWRLPGPFRPHHRNEELRQSRASPSPGSGRLTMAGMAVWCPWRMRPTPCLLQSLEAGEHRTAGGWTVLTGLWPGT